MHIESHAWNNFSPEFWRYLSIVFSLHCWLWGSTVSLLISFLYIPMWKPFEPYVYCWNLAFLPVSPFYHLHPSPCIWTLSIWALSHSLGSIYCLLTFKTSNYSLLFLPYRLLKFLLDECWIVWIEPQCLLNVLLFSKLYLCVCLFCILAYPFNFFFYNNNLVMVLSILQPFINFKKF